MKPLITKKYIFSRRLDGNPICLDLMTAKNRLRLRKTWELLHTCDIIVDIQDRNYSTIATHPIKFIVPRDRKPHTLHLPKGMKFTRPDNIVLIR